MFCLVQWWVLCNMRRARRATASSTIDPATVPTPTWLALMTCLAHAIWSWSGVNAALMTGICADRRLAGESLGNGALECLPQAVGVGDVEKR
jgi:hypothetical protein